MAKMIRSTLTFGSQLIRNIDDFDRFFNLKNVIESFENKSLQRWFLSREMDDVVSRLKELTGDCVELARGLCEIFGKEYSEEDIQSICGVKINNVSEPKETAKKQKYNSPDDLSNKAKEFSKKAEILFQEKKYEEAINYLNEAIRLYGVNNIDSVNQCKNKLAICYQCKGIVCNTKGEYSYAIEFFEKALKYDPQNAGYYHDRSIAYFSLNKYNDALSDINRAIELEPQKAEFYNYRGLIYEKKEEYHSSIIDYKKAIDIKNDDPHFYYNLARSYMETMGSDRYDNAITYLGEAIKLYEVNNNIDSVNQCKNNLAICYQGKGNICNNKGEYGYAIEFFEKALKHCEDDELKKSIKVNKAKTYANNANRFFDNKNYKEASDCYSDALIYDPQNAGYYHNRGAARTYLNRWREALLDFEEAMRLEPYNEIHKKEFENAQKQASGINGVVNKLFKR